MLLWAMLGLAWADEDIQDVDWRGVKARRMVEPAWPKEELGRIEEVSCQVEITIDERGEPTHVEVSRCPLSFHREILFVAERWRFFPYRDDDGVAQPARFVIKLTFREGRAPHVPDDDVLWLGGSGQLSAAFGSTPVVGWGLDVAMEDTSDRRTTWVGVGFERLGERGSIVDAGFINLSLGVGVAAVSREHLRVGPDVRLEPGLGLWLDAGRQVGLGGIASVGLPVSVISTRSVGVRLRPHLSIGRYGLSDGFTLPLQIGAEASVGFR